MDSVQKAVSFLLQEMISDAKEQLDESNPKVLTVEQRKKEAEKLLKQLQK